MNIITNQLKIPKLDFQYINRNGAKLFRVKSEKLDPIFKNMLLDGKIRVQIWLEREVKKISGDKRKRSWVHSQDFSNKAPLKLFTSDQYDYGGGDGWGWKSPSTIPSYSTTNGIVPTEYEIISNDIFNNGCITKEIPILDIFSNILKRRKAQRCALNNDPLNLVAIVGRGKSNHQSLRVKLVINYNGKPLFSDPSNELVLGIHQEGTILSTGNLKNYIKVGKFI